MQNQDTTVLVAINDVFFYTKVRDALKVAGYRLERARTQAEVLERAMATAPAAILLNLNEEKFDPFCALDQLRGQERLKSVPVLAFANHEEVETWKRAKELGVTKIVSRNEFSSRTRELVDELVALRDQLTAASPRSAS